MPLYEYQCKKCGHRFEKIQKFSDAMLKKCPECGGKIEQMLSAPAAHFKGSGWYVTDYPKKSSGAPSSGSEGSDSAAKGDSAKDSSSKKDGKPKAEASSTKSDKK
jgi:putative FmdB family regulatory protein